MIKGLGLERLPAIVHLGMDATVIAAAEGWHPGSGRPSPTNWPACCSGRVPHLPVQKDPAPYDGTPALA